MAARGLYQDCASEDTAETIAQLRPQGPAPIVERTPLIETPSVPMRYIACTQDRAVFRSGERSPRGNASARPSSGSTPRTWSRPDDLAEVLVKPHGSQ